MLSLVLIAIGYRFAHYFSYLVVQIIVPLAPDPFGLASDGALFGMAGRPLDDINAVDMSLVWIVAGGGVVAGDAARSS